MSTEASSPAAPADDLLRLLVAWAARPGLEISVTLFVEGTTVSGYIASAATYLEEMGKQLSIATPPSVPELARLFREKFAEMAQNHREKQEADEPPESDFVHLRKVQVRTGDKVINPDWVRIRLSKVSGFMLGTSSER